MTKAEIISEVSTTTGMTKKDSGAAVEAMLSAVTKGLKKDGKVTIVGFGNFSATKKAARKGRNPKTGEEVTIPARTVVKFSIGKELKESVQ